MADFDNPLDEIAVAQAQPAVTANELFDALSMAAYGARRASTSTGLVWGYYGGRWEGSAVAHGTLSLTNSSTNYIVVARAGGAISFSTGTTDWNDTANYARLYLVTTAGGAVTDWDDYRQITFY